MYILGITGSFGSGKTTVAHLLRRKGDTVLDADKIAHRFLVPGKASFDRIVKYFGSKILTQGRIDRRKLAKIVFDDPKSLKKLDSVLHPEVIKEINIRVKKHRAKKSKSFLIIDAPLLFETGLQALCDYVVVVRARRDLQVARIQQRSSLSKTEILKRMKAQMPSKEKIVRADFVIDNQGHINQTKKQVEELWQRLTRMKK
ncbi:MAG: dephospho-CoA kinase [Candidatus Omnitrophota bacterium]